MKTWQYTPGLPKRHREEVELLSIHIPKSAGTSFLDALACAYGRKDVAFFQQQWDLPEYWPAAITGHFELTRFSGICSNARTVTWLRDPAARVLSHFYFWRSEASDDVELPLRAAVRAGRLGINEFIKCKEVQNLAVAMLCHVSPDKLDFVGIPEYYASDLADLKVMLGWPEVPVLHTNKTALDPEYLAARSDEDLIARIRKANKLDVALYMQALKMREERFKTGVEPLPPFKSVNRTVVAMLDEVVETPALLEAFAREFGTDRRVALAIYAPNSDETAAISAITPALTQLEKAGHDANMELLVVPSSFELDLVERASAMLTERRPSGPLRALPPFGRVQMPALRQFIF